jgi:hypothetical protein
MKQVLRQISALECDTGSHRAPVPPPWLDIVANARPNMMVTATDSQKVSSKRGTKANTVVAAAFSTGFRRETADSTTAW